MKNEFIKCKKASWSSIQVRIIRDKVTWPGARMRKANEGMPSYENNNFYGALIITFDVEFPKGTYTDEEKDSKISWLEGPHLSNRKPSYELPVATSVNFKWESCCGLTNIYFHFTKQFSIS